MNLFEIHLIGQRAPLKVELECDDVHELVDHASKSRFVIGYLAQADEFGCHPKLMIATSRIVCATELN